MLAHEIDESSWRGDDHIDATAQRIDLRPLADAAKNRDAEDAVMSGQRPDRFVDLCGELARWRENEDAGYAAADGRRSGELFEKRQHEGCGFTRAGLRDADDVVACQNVRDGGGLNRRRRLIAGGVYGLENFRAEPE